MRKGKGKKGIEEESKKQKFFFKKGRNIGRVEKKVRKGK